MEKEMVTGLGHLEVHSTARAWAGGWGGMASSSVYSSSTTHYLRPTNHSWAAIRSTHEFQHCHTPSLYGYKRKGGHGRRRGGGTEGRVSHVAQKQKRSHLWKEWGSAGGEG